MLSGSGVVANEKEAMQDLNDRLATYLEKVRSLEQENRRLEVQIREVMAKRGPSARDWSHYWDVIEELRDKVGVPAARPVSPGWRWQRGVKH